MVNWESRRLEPPLLYNEGVELGMKGKEAEDGELGGWN